MVRAVICERLLTFCLENCDRNGPQNRSAFGIAQRSEILIEPRSSNRVANRIETGRDSLLRRNETVVRRLRLGRQKYDSTADCIIDSPTVGQIERFRFALGITGLTRYEIGNPTGQLRQRNVCR